MLPTDFRPTSGQCVASIWLVSYSKLCGCHHGSATRSYHVGLDRIMGDRGSEFPYQFTCLFIFGCCFDIDVYFTVCIWVKVIM